MFKHLLVPLDGSHLAESALPIAAKLAEKLGAAVTLIHIIERNAPKEIHSERHLTNPEEAQAYLSEVAKQYFPPDIPIRLHVHTTEVSDVARSIAAHSEELAPDLIVMCTHGRGGLLGWIYGSIAQQVIAIGETPVLIVRPERVEQRADFHCRKLLVTLDGFVEHEQGMQVAVGLAEACPADLHLLMVIPNFSDLTGEQAAASRMAPGATSAILDSAEQGGEEYLRRHLERLQQAGIQATAEIARGDPVNTIVNTAREVGANLIVLGTHGKTGMDAFWSGSATPKISGRSPVPLLLVPVRESGTS